MLLDHACSISPLAVRARRARTLVAVVCVTLAAVATAVAATPARAATTATIAASSMSLPASSGTTFADSSATGGTALLIWSNATASASVTTAAAQAIVVRARGDQCQGAPHMIVSVDGRTVLSQAVPATAWTNYAADAAIPAGTHTVSVSFDNDYLDSSCDRNLRVDSVALRDTRGFAAAAMALPSCCGHVWQDSSAAEGSSLEIWTFGTATIDYATAQAVRSIAVTARGDLCAGAPQMVVAVDGHTVLTQAVDTTSWHTYSVNAALPAGSHTVAISFTNDYLTASCDRNLWLDSVRLAASAGAPLAGARLYVDPNSSAAQQAQAWQSSRPADAAQMQKIASQPQADWFGGWSGDIQSAVNSRVSTVTAAGAVPLLVAYDIYERDCGGYSSGGASSPDAYRSWIRGFAAGIGDRRAVVLLEPDALAGLDCLSATDQATRYGLLSDAVSVLAAHTGVSVYIDAGHSRWHSPADIATRLQAAGVTGAQGFSLNVSNFLFTSDEQAYGDQVSALTGGAHFVLDTSRNGLGPSPDGQWCNPSGRALGNRPTAATGDAIADAYLWIKRPGESDGSCNGGPAGGVWWADYALGLAQRAAY
jgi:endoglucanase